MIDQTIISQLKQINVSKDSNKTKERISELWKASNSKQKKKIIAFGNSNASSIYRVTRLGNVSVKIVLAFAHICNVNPYYLTGETNDLTECSNALLNSFLTDCGYGELVGKQTKKQTKKQIVINDIDTFDEDNNTLEIDDYDNTTTNLQEICESDSVEIANSQITFKESGDLVFSIINLFSQRQLEMTDAQISIIQTLPLDEVDYLLKALSIKSKAGGNASIIYKIIKLLLIS